MSIILYRYKIMEKEKNGWFFLMMRTLWIYSFSIHVSYSNINCHHHVVHDVPSIYLRTACLYLLTNFIQFPLPLPTSNNHESDGIFCELFYPLKVRHISEIVQYWSFCLWFTSLSIILLRFICIVSNGRISLFFWLNGTHPHTHLLYLFAHQWTLRLFPCFVYCK